ncbi:MAG TPA: hypothetical protein VJB17_01590 [Patescibacteria group bacterium]|nr:hypothetical protein [Patescibacteria group bacterium]
MDILAQGSNMVVYKLGDKVLKISKYACHKALQRSILTDYRKSKKLTGIYTKVPTTYHAFFDRADKMNIVESYEGESIKAIIIRSDQIRSDQIRYAC